MSCDDPEANTVDCRLQCFDGNAFDKKNLDEIKRIEEMLTKDPEYKNFW